MNNSPRTRSTTPARWSALLGLCLAAVACTSEPAGPPAAAMIPGGKAATLRLAAVDAAGNVGGGQRELAVQPLRDQAVQDLSEAAAKARVARDYRREAMLLDQALALAPADPALLQERGEAALLQDDYAAAEMFARRAFDHGSQVGPLCRRHWALVEQSLLARDHATPAAEAHGRIDGCTVAAPNRF